MLSSPASTSPGVVTSPHIGSAALAINLLRQAPNILREHVAVNMKNLLAWSLPQYYEMGI